ncbi:MAG: hypothetical protein ABIL62_18440, partial [Planctomycetota bacterium]
NLRMAKLLIKCIQQNCLPGTIAVMSFALYHSVSLFSNPHCKCPLPLQPCQKRLLQNDKTLKQP